MSEAPHRRDWDVETDDYSDLDDYMGYNSEQEGDGGSDDDHVYGEDGDPVGVGEGDDSDESRRLSLPGPRANVYMPSKNAYRRARNR